MANPINLNGNLPVTRAASKDTKKPTDAHAQAARFSRAVETRSEGTRESTRKLVRKKKREKLRLQKKHAARLAEQRRQQRAEAARPQAANASSSNRPQIRAETTPARRPPEPPAEARDRTFKDQQGQGRDGQGQGGQQHEHDQDAWNDEGEWPVNRRPRPRATHQTETARLSDSPPAGALTALDLLTRRPPRPAPTSVDARWRYTPERLHRLRAQGHFVEPVRYQPAPGMQPVDILGERHKQGHRLDVLDPDTGERLTTLKLQAADVYGPSDSPTGLTAGARYFGPGGITLEAVRDQIIRNDELPSRAQMATLNKASTKDGSRDEMQRSMQIRPSQLLALMQREARGGVYSTRYFMQYGNVIFHHTLRLIKDRTLPPAEKTELLNQFSQRAAELALLYIENIEHFTTHVLAGQNPRDQYAQQALVKANEGVVGAASHYANNPVCAQACTMLTEWLSDPHNLNLSKLDWRNQKTTGMFVSLTNTPAAPALEALTIRIGDFIASNPGLLRINPENRNQHWVSPLWLNLAGTLSRFADHEACRRGLIQIAKWISDLGWEHIEAYLSLPRLSRIVTFLVKVSDDDNVRTCLNRIAESIHKRTSSLAPLYWTGSSHLVNIFDQLTNAPGSEEEEEQEREYFELAIRKVAGFVVDNHRALEWGGSPEDHRARADFGRNCKNRKDSEKCQAVVPRIAERVNLRSADIKTLGEYAFIFIDYPENAHCKARLTQIVDIVVNHYLQRNQLGQQVIKDADRRCLGTLLSPLSEIKTPNSRRLAIQIAEQILRAEPPDCGLQEQSPLSLAHFSAAFFHFYDGFDTDCFSRVSQGITREIIRRSPLRDDGSQSGEPTRDMRWLEELNDRRPDILLRSPAQLPATADSRAAAEIIATYVATKGADWLATLDNAALRLLGTLLSQWSDIPACEELRAMVKEVYADAVTGAGDQDDNQRSVPHRLNTLMAVFGDDQEAQAEALIREHILDHVAEFSATQLAIIIQACAEYPDNPLFRQLETQIAQHVASPQFDPAGLTARHIGKFLSTWNAHPTNPDYRDAAVSLASLIASGQALSDDTASLRGCARTLRPWLDEPICRQAMIQLAGQCIGILDAAGAQSPLDERSYAALLNGFGLLADEDSTCDTAGRQLLASLAERLENATSDNHPDDNESAPRAEGLSALLHALRHWTDAPQFDRVISHLAQQARMLEITAQDGRHLALLLRNLGHRPEPACQEALSELLKKIARSELGGLSAKALSALTYQLTCLATRDHGEEDDDAAAGDLPIIDEDEILNALRPVLNALRQQPETLRQAGAQDVLNVLQALTAIPSQTRAWLEPLPGSAEEQPTLLEACLERLRAPGLLAGTGLDTLGQLGAALSRLVASPAPSKEQRAQLLVFLMRDLRPQVEEKLALYERCYPAEVDLDQEALDAAITQVANATRPVTATLAELLDARGALEQAQESVFSALQAVEREQRLSANVRQQLRRHLGDAVAVANTALNAQTPAEVRANAEQLVRVTVAARNALGSSRHAALTTSLQNAAAAATRAATQANAEAELREILRAAILQIGRSAVPEEAEAALRGHVDTVVEEVLHEEGLAAALQHPARVGLGEILERAAQSALERVVRQRAANTRAASSAVWQVARPAFALHNVLRTYDAVIARWDRKHLGALDDQAQVTALLREHRQEALRRWNTDLGERIHRLAAGDLSGLSWRLIAQWTNPEAPNDALDQFCRGNAEAITRVRAPSVFDPDAPFRLDQPLGSLDDGEGLCRVRRYKLSGKELPSDNTPVFLLLNALTQGTITPGLVELPAHVSTFMLETPVYIRDPNTGRKVAHRMDIGLGSKGKVKGPNVLQAYRQGRAAAETGRRQHREQDTGALFLIPMAETVPGTAFEQLMRALFPYMSASAYFQRMLMSTPPIDGLHPHAHVLKGRFELGIHPNLPGGSVPVTLHHPKYGALRLPLITDDGCGILRESEARKLGLWEPLNQLPRYGGTVPKGNLGTQAMQYLPRSEALAEEMSALLREKLEEAAAAWDGAHRQEALQAALAAAIPGLSLAKLASGAGKDHTGVLTETLIALARDTDTRVGPLIDALTTGPDALPGAKEQAHGDRIKSAFALREKLQLKQKQAAEAQAPAPAPETIAAAINDAARYCLTLNDHTYGKDVERVLQRFEAAGCTLTALDETFTDPQATYKGLRLALRTPEGTRFEVQLLTAKAHTAKVNTHKTYKEAQRLHADHARYQALLAREAAEGTEAWTGVTPEERERLQRQSAAFEDKQAWMREQVRDIRPPKGLRPLLEGLRTQLATPPSHAGETLPEAFTQALEATRARRAQATSEAPAPIDRALLRTCLEEELAAVLPKVGYTTFRDIPDAVLKRVLEAVHLPGVEALDVAALREAVREAYTSLEAQGRVPGPEARPNRVGALNADDLARAITGGLTKGFMGVAVPVAGNNVLLPQAVANAAAVRDGTSVNRPPNDSAGNLRSLPPGQVVTGDMPAAPEPTERAPLPPLLQTYLGTLERLALQALPDEAHAAARLATAQITRQALQAEEQKTPGARAQILGQLWNYLLHRALKQVLAEPDERRDACLRAALAEGLNDVLPLAGDTVPDFRITRQLLDTAFSQAKARLPTLQAIYAHHQREPDAAAVAAAELTKLYNRMPLVQTSIVCAELDDQGNPGNRIGIKNLMQIVPDELLSKDTPSVNISVDDVKLYSTWGDGKDRSVLLGPNGQLKVKIVGGYLVINQALGRGSAYGMPPWLQALMYGDFDGDALLLLLGNAALNRHIQASGAGSTVYCTENLAPVKLPKKLAELTAGDETAGAPAQEQATAKPLKPIKKVENRVQDGHYRYSMAHLYMQSRLGVLGEFATLQNAFRSLTPAQTEAFAQHLVAAVYAGMDWTLKRDINALLYEPDPTAEAVEAVLLRLHRLHAATDHPAVAAQAADLIEEIGEWATGEQRLLLDPDVLAPPQTPQTDPGYWELARLLPDYAVEKTAALPGTERLEKLLEFTYIRFLDKAPGVFIPGDLATTAENTLAAGNKMGTDAFKSGAELHDYLRAARALNKICGQKRLNIPMDVPYNAKSVARAIGKGTFDKDAKLERCARIPNFAAQIMECSLPLVDAYGMLPAPGEKLAEQPGNRTHGVRTTGVGDDLHAHLALALAEDALRTDQHLGPIITRIATETQGMEREPRERIRPPKEIRQEIRAPRTGAQPPLLSLGVITSRIGDALRYSLSYPPEHFGDAVASAITALREAGCTVQRWDSGAASETLVLRAPPPDKALFQVCFHTDASYAAERKCRQLQRQAAPLQARHARYQALRQQPPAEPLPREQLDALKRDHDRYQVLTTQIAQLRTEVPPPPTTSEALTTLKAAHTLEASLPPVQESLAVLARQWTEHLLKLAREVDTRIAPLLVALPGVAWVNQDDTRFPSQEQHEKWIMRQHDIQEMLTGANITPEAQRQARLYATINTIGIRYHAVVPEHSFADATEQAITRLVGAGQCKLYKLIDHFANRDAQYKGVIAHFEGRGGLCFEVQFHTPASLELAQSQEQIALLEQTRAVMPGHKLSKALTVSEQTAAITEEVKAAEAHYQQHLQRLKALARRLPPLNTADLGGLVDRLRQARKDKQVEQQTARPTGATAPTATPPATTASRSAPWPQQQPSSSSTSSSPGSRPTASSAPPLTTSSPSTPAPRVRREPFDYITENTMGLPVTRRHHGYRITNADGHGLRAFNEPRTGVPLHLAQQGHLCGLQTLNMLNWLLLAGSRTPAPPLDTLCAALTDSDALNAFIDNLGLSAEERGQRQARLNFADAVSFNAAKGLPALQWSAAQLNAAERTFELLGDTCQATPAQIDRLPAIGITYRPRSGSSAGDHSVLIARHGNGFAAFDPRQPTPIHLNATSLSTALYEFADTRSAQVRFGRTQGRFFDLLIPAGAQARTQPPPPVSRATPTGTPGQPTATASSGSTALPPRIQALLPMVARLDNRDPEVLSARFDGGPQALLRTQARFDDADAVCLEHVVQSTGARQRVIIARDPTSLRYTAYNPTTGEQRPGPAGMTTLGAALQRYLQAYGATGECRLLAHRENTNFTIDYMAEDDE
ncbi:MAG: hypothetical protein WD609_00870 [Aquisalimonadaceae bacterium]